MDTKLLTRFESALADNQLDSLVEEMKAEGYTQVEVYDKFAQFCHLLTSAGRAEDEDRILELMDRIWGWTTTDQQLFPDFLTDEKIRDHRLPSQEVKKTSLPEGWFYATPEEQKSLWKELKKELPAGHLLFNKSVQVIAHRDGATDDILCQHLDEPNRYTVVHLTWSMKREIDARYPPVEVDGSFADFIAYENKFNRPAGP